jgi:RNA polymerase sigma-70 factor (ECF subfamily)
MRAEGAGGLVDDRDDEFLVLAARRGDADAWERIYRRLYPRLAAYLGRRVGFEHAEDAVSETMARAVAGLDRMTLGPAGFDGWVFGIARRVAADHHRRAGRHRRQDLAASFADGPPQEADASLDRLVVADEHAEIRRAFAQLSPGERELLELRVVAGLSADDAAAVLGKQAGAIRTAQSRALARLRQLLDASVPVVQVGR